MTMLNDECILLTAIERVRRSVSHEELAALLVLEPAALALATSAPRVLGPIERLKIALLLCAPDGMVPALEADRIDDFAGAALRHETLVRFEHDFVAMIDRELPARATTAQIMATTRLVLSQIIGVEIREPPPAQLQQCPRLVQ